VLSLYCLCVETIEEPGLNSDLDLDIVTDLKVLSKCLFARLDPSIKYHVKRPGIGVVQNTYTGFDTEFNNMDVGENKLVSIQLAVSTKTYLKIPFIKSYKISCLEAKTNKLIPLSRNSSVLNYSKIEGSIDMCVKRIKSLKYGKYEESMFILNESLRNIKGFSYFENDDYTIFTFPHSGIQTYIEIGESNSFSKVVRISTKIAQPSHTQVFNVLITLIKQICSSGLTLENGKERFFEQFYPLFNEDTSLTDLVKGYEKELPTLYPEDILLDGNKAGSTKVKCKKLTRL